MSNVMTRIQCLQLSERLKAKFSALKMTQEEVAEALVSFASEEGDAGIQPRMAALEIAVQSANPRGNPDSVLTHARTIMGFANTKPEPKATQKETQKETSTPAPTRAQRGRGKSRTSR